MVGLVPSGHSIVDNLVHLALGVFGILLGFGVPGRALGAAAP